MAKPTNRAANNFDRLFGTSQGSRAAAGLLLIDRDRIETGEQPRQHFANEELQTLAASIRERRAVGEGVEGTGILQPLLVSALPDNRFRLIAGERRFRAAAIVGLPQVPAVVVPLRADELLVTQLVENLQRADLSALEEADAIAQLAENQKLSVRRLAEVLGKDRGWVQNRLRLRKTGDDVKAMLAKRRDSLPHAFEIDAIADAELRSLLIAQTLEGASVAQIRHLIGANAPANSAVSFQNDTAVQNEPLETTSENSKATEKQTQANNQAQANNQTPTNANHSSDPVNAALAPANTYIAQAVRHLKTTELSHEQRLAVHSQLEALEKSLKTLRRRLEKF